MSVSEINNLVLSYENLNVKNPYTIRDSAELLKKLLPKGVIWRIDLPNEMQIKNIGILSNEAFGELLVSLQIGYKYINVNSILSVENFGDVIVNKNILNVNSINSGEAFGDAYIGYLYIIPIESDFGTKSNPLINATFTMSFRVYNNYSTLITIDDYLFFNDDYLAFDIVFTNGNNIPGNGYLDIDIIFTVIVYRYGVFKSDFKLSFHNNILPLREVFGKVKSNVVYS